MKHSLLVIMKEDHITECDFNCRKGIKKENSTKLYKITFLCSTNFLVPNSSYRYSDQGESATFTQVCVCVCV